MNRLFVIDGSSILTTFFYATVRDKRFFKAKTEAEREPYYKNLTKTDNGVYVNGVGVMLKVIFKLIESFRISHIAVTWDMDRASTFRRKLYKPYKANRLDIPVPLKEQYITMQKTLKLLNIPQFMDKLYEADDFIGSLSEKFSHEIQTIIYSKDQDILQLINKNTKVWLIMSSIKRSTLTCKYGLSYKYSLVPKNVFEFNEDLVKYEYGLYPNQIPDFKSLAGDACDNIPGVKGIGPKTAVKLLNKFNSIDNLYKFMDETSIEEVKQCFKSMDMLRSPLNFLIENNKDKLYGKEAAMLSKKLATIKTDIPTINTLNLNDLKVFINFKAKNYIMSRLKIK